MSSELRKWNRLEQSSMLCSGALLATACSFFTPSTADYSRDYGLGGASGEATAGSAGRDEASAGKNESGSGGFGDNAGAAGVSDAGAGGEAGEPEAVLGQRATTSDVTLQAVITYGLPPFAVLTEYGIEEVSAQKWQELPSYAPYSSTEPAWWDNLVAEQLQARAPLIAFPTTGVYSLDAADLTGPGTMNPRQLSRWTAAVTRAGATTQFQTICVVDTSRLAEVSNKLHNKPTGTAMDLSVAADWKDVFWLRAIKPFFDTIPKSYWLNFAVGNRPLVYLGPLPATSYKNAAGNLGNLLTAVSDAFSAAYGIAPAFVLDSTWITLESAVGSNASVVASSPWFEPPTTVSYAFTTYKNVINGSIVPGFKNGTLTIPRTSTDSYGNEVSTLATGFSQFQNRYIDFGITLVEGFNDGAQSAALYRSTSPTWSSPNQYLNLLRSYTDPKTATVRLEAEGSDRYFDTTMGNANGAFRRDGDLDVRALTAGGWAVTNTVAGEWLEYADVAFSSGDYRFSAQYATPSGDASNKRLQLVIDGEPLRPIIVPNTTNTETFQTVILGARTMAHGKHTLRIRFLDGRVDLDWLFVKKTSTALKLLTRTTRYLSASHGGGRPLDADSEVASVWEQFTFDDLNGGALENGDAVNIQTYNGFYLGYASALAATARVPGQTERFVLKTADGLAVHNGSVISLQTADLAHYLTVVSNTLVDISGTAIGTPQMLTVGL